MTDLADGSRSGDLTEEARYYDYASTANPLFAGLIPPVPYQSFSPEFFERTTSGILPLDVSEEMKLLGPATSPSLLANFVRIVKGRVTTTALATSQLFFVFQGSGRTEACGRGEDAHVLPIQDAGLHTYLRTLDILYSHPDHDRTSHISQKP